MINLCSQSPMHRLINLVLRQSPPYQPDVNFKINLNATTIERTIHIPLCVAAFNETKHSWELANAAKAIGT